MKATDTAQERRRALRLIEYAWEEKLLEARGPPMKQDFE